MKGLLSRPQSPLIGGCNTFAPRSPHYNPTPLVRGNNKPARLILTTKWSCVHHLKAIICRIFTEGVSLSRPTDSTLYSSCMRPICARGAHHKEAIPRSYLPMERFD
ncbi:hypothetical protein TNCV_2856691 [Trichonephila clavipes]|nr:hypothetical protein TNCV_2856691 [Trichonephila clavipes]